MLTADRFLNPPVELAEYVFNYYDWDTRPQVLQTTVQIATGSPKEQDLGGYYAALARRYRPVIAYQGAGDDPTRACG